MSRDVRSIIINIMVILLVAVVYFGIRSYREELLLGTLKDTLYKYFKENNEHISSHDFAIDNVRIRCRGNNAYIVEFNIPFSDDTSIKLNNLAATVYKENNTWHVKGLSYVKDDELEAYDFKCYN